MNEGHNPARMSRMFPAFVLSFYQLSGIKPFLHPTCSVSVLYRYCLCPVLHLTCPASIMSCIWLVLHMACPTSVTVLHLFCPASDLSNIRPGLHMTCPTSVTFQNQNMSKEVHWICLSLLLVNFVAFFAQYMIFPADVLSSIRHFLQPFCLPSVLFCMVWPVLHLTCPVFILSCNCPVLHPSKNS